MGFAVIDQMGWSGLGPVGASCGDEEAQRASSSGTSSSSSSNSGSIGGSISRSSSGSSSSSSSKWGWQQQ